MITFVVPGEPVAKARARVALRGGKVHAYTPKRTEDYERAVALAAKAAAVTRLAGPVALDVVAVFEVPASWSRARREAAIGAPHTSRPDGDNIAKAVADALNGIAWDDDSQVAELRVVKVYGAVPCVRVTVRALAAKEAA